MREIIKENKVCEKDKQQSLSEDAITWGGVVFFKSCNKVNLPLICAHD